MINQLCIKDEGGKYIPTSLQAGDLVCLTKDRVLSFSRGHIALSFSPSAETGKIEGDFDFNLIISLFREPQNSKEFFGVTLKERHKSPEGDKVYFIVCE